MIRSDVGDTHRLSLSARVVSALDRQVKVKPQAKKRLCHGRNRRNRDFETRLVAPLKRGCLKSRWLVRYLLSLFVEATLNEPRLSRPTARYYPGTIGLKRYKTTSGFLARGAGCRSRSRQLRSCP